jgi:hypothetical protein
MPVTEGFVCWTEPIGTVGPCQYITNRLGCIRFAARAGSITTKPADAVLTQISSLGIVDGINCYIYSVCPQVSATPTTTTTVAPITLTLTASCIGSGINGTGRIVANGFTGGTGTFANIKIGNSLSNAAAATPVVLSGATSYTWNNLVNSTWFVILTDNAGNSNYAQIVVSCTNTTSTTTTTTTQAPQCTFNGGTASIIYGTSTTTTTTAASTSTTTTTIPPTTTSTSTSTTSTSTSTSTSTTTSAPTTTTTTTNAYNYYLATAYTCTNCTIAAYNIRIAFPAGFYPNKLRWYRPSTPNGYVYQVFSATTPGSSVNMNTVSYTTCYAACALTTTSTSTTSTSTSTTSTSTSTTTAAPILISVQLDEYDGGNPPYLDMDMVVAGSTYYYDGGAYTQNVPANLTSTITLKTKDGNTSHTWGSFTTASAVLKVFEDGILIVNQTNFYRKNEGAIDFTSGVTFNSGKTYIVSGSNWAFVGAQPTTTTTTSTSTTSTSTSTTTTTLPPAASTSTTSTTTIAYPPYSYTLYYDYDDSLPNVIGFTTANDVCNAVQSATVYSYDNPLVVNSQLYCEAWYGGIVGIAAQDYTMGSQHHYRIGNDVIRFTNDGMEGPTNIIYDFVQTCGPTYTLVDVSNPCGIGDGCATSGTSKIYFDSTDNAAFIANGNVFGGIGGGAPTTCTAIARDVSGNALSTRYHFEFDTGVCWKITAGNFSYNANQC